MSRFPSAPTIPAGPAYLAPVELLDRERERRRQRAIARRLFDGDWRSVFLTMSKSQHVFRETLRADGSIDRFFATFNLFGRAITLFADFVANRPPVLSVPEDHAEQRRAIDRVRDACLFDALFHEGILRARLEGRAVILPDVDEVSGSAVLCLLDNDQIFPAGPAGKDRQPAVWERRWIVERRDPLAPNRPRRFLRVERHRVVNGAGLIEQEAYRVERSDTLHRLDKLQRVALADVMEPGAASPPEILFTGLRLPLPVAIVNYVVRDEPQLTVTDAELDMMDAASKQLSDLARAMAVHASPKMRITEDLVDAKTGMARISAECYVDPDKVIDYIRVEFAFEQMLTFLNKLHQYVLVQLEVSQALLGMKFDGGATPDTFDKLRLESVGTVAAAQRSTAYVVPALRRAWTMACELDARRPLGAPGETGYAVAPVGVRLRVGLPKDEMDLVREEREKLDAGLTSRRRAIAEVHGEDQAEAILAEIEGDLEAGAARQRDALFGALPNKREEGAAA